MAVPVLVQLNLLIVFVPVPNVVLPTPDLVNVPMTLLPDKLNSCEEKQLTVVTVSDVKLKVELVESIDDKLVMTALLM